MTSSFGYYLISYEMKYIRGNIYLNCGISSFSELLANVFSALLYNRIGFKKTFVISYMIGLVGMLFLVMTDTLQYGWLSLFILGSKFGVSSTFNIAFIAIYQIFPATIMATCFGVCNVGARFATILSPYVAELKPDAVSQWIFIGTCALALIPSISLIDKSNQNQDEDEDKDKDEELALS